MNDISGFVYQDDLFIGSLTVMEHLIFMVNTFFSIENFRNSTEKSIQSHIFHKRPIYDSIAEYQKFRNIN